MSEPLVIGIDLGATNLKAAIVDSRGNILHKENRPLSDLAPDSVIAEMAVLSELLLDNASLKKDDLSAVGIGAPGPLSHRTGCIIRSANLPGWSNVPLRDRVSERLNVPVVLDNDGNAAAYGEFWAGAGHDQEDLVMLTLGTGVGAGVILDGKVLHGHFENAAELGHWIVCVDGLPCSCGQRGCLEQYASASNVARRVLDAIHDDHPCTLSQAVKGGKAITAESVEDAARASDALCLRIWDEACLYLAVACIAIQHAFNPARVVLGGGMARAGNFLIDRVNEHVRRQRWDLYEDLPSITQARLGYDAGVIGAAGLAWQVLGRVD